MIGPGSDYGDQMWKDLTTIDNCLYNNGVLKECKPFKSFLHHLHFSFLLNRYFTLPFQNIWDNSYFLSNLSFEKNKRYCIIFTDVSACRTGISFIRKLSSKENVDLILINVNVFNSKKRLLLKRLPFFTKIYTFDISDSKEYSFLYYPKFYSVYGLDTKDASDYAYDALFVGSSKGRALVLSKIADKMVQDGLRPCFYITGTKKSERISKNVIYNKRIDYDKVISLLKKSKCVVELLAENQKGSTLRYVEAVCFNKLLLTNNVDAVHDMYFQSGNVQIFNNESDFSTSFIKDSAISPYNYEGEYSPIHFLNELSS